VSWLIEGLEALGVAATPSKIERLQTKGLAPRPLHHRSRTLSGEDLWPDGALQHYAAVVPLLRQRHDATEMAAVTMVGWGYPIDIDTLRKAYAKIYFHPQDQVLIDRTVERYRNHGFPMLRVSLDHLRSHGLVQRGQAPDELAENLLEGLVAAATGRATKEQFRMMLAAAYPNFGAAPERVIDAMAQVMTMLQMETSTDKLYETVLHSTTEELLEIQGPVAADISAAFEHLGFTSEDCSNCSETVGLMIGAALPYFRRLMGLDLSRITQMLLQEYPELMTKT